MSQTDSQTPIQNNILIISASSSIAQHMIDILVDNPHNRVLLHARPTSQLAHKESSQVVHLPRLDILNPVYTSSDDVTYHSNDAYEKWFQDVMTQYMPQIMIVATGGEEHSVSNALQINAGAPIKFCETFVQLHKADRQQRYDPMRDASEYVPLIIFMNSISADYAPRILGTYSQSKELMTHLLWSLYRQYRCAIVNAKITAVDTRFFDNDVHMLRQIPSIAQSILNAMKVTPAKAAQDIAQYVKLHTRPTYRTVYVTHWWRWINCIIWYPLYIVTGLLRIIDMVIVQGYWR